MFGVCRVVRWFMWLEWIGEGEAVDNEGRGEVEYRMVRGFEGD